MPVHVPCLACQTCMRPLCKPAPICGSVPLPACGVESKGRVDSLFSRLRARPCSLLGRPERRPYGMLAPSMSRCGKVDLVGHVFMTQRPEISQARLFSELIGQGTLCHYSRDVAALSQSVSPL